MYSPVVVLFLNTHETKDVKVLFSNENFAKSQDFLSIRFLLFYVLPTLHAILGAH